MACPSRLVSRVDCPCEQPRFQESACSPPQRCVRSPRLCPQVLRSSPGLATGFPEPRWGGWSPVGTRERPAQPKPWPRLARALVSVRRWETAPPRRPRAIPVPAVARIGCGPAGPQRGWGSRMTTSRPRPLAPRASGHRRSATRPAGGRRTAPHRYPADRGSRLGRLAHLPRTSTSLVR